MLIPYSLVERYLNNIKAKVSVADTNSYRD